MESPAGSQPSGLVSGKVFCAECCGGVIAGLLAGPLYGVGSGWLKRMLPWIKETEKPVGANSELIDVERHAHKIPANTAAHERYNSNGKNDNLENGHHDGVEDPDIMGTNPSPLYAARPNSREELVTMV